MYNRGISLIETVVMLAVFGILMLGITELILGVFQKSTQGFAASNQVDQVQSVVTNFGNELRNAQSGNDGSYALAEASSTEIIFFSNYGSTASTTMYRYRYYIQGTNLNKGVIKPSGTPISYPSASEATTTVLRNIVLGATSTFLYFDGNYAGTSTSLSQPVNVNQVKYVVLTLYPLKLSTRTSTTTYVMSSGTTIRSLKTNLGN